MEKEKWICVFKRRMLLSGFALAIILSLLLGSSVMAAMDFEIAGRPASIKGFINQGLSFGIGKDEYFSKQGLQSAIFQLLLEGKYDPSNNISMFVSGMLNVDWAYELLSGNQEWNDKRFNDSRDRLYILHDYDDLLKEAHVTWKTESFVLRVGKQIVSWGETDGVRLADQINPLDQRRGFGDIKFESTIIPIWLVKAEYFHKTDSSWLQDLGLEMIFNPNMDFIPDKGLGPGTDYMGIWAPKVNVALGGPFPFDYAHVGSFDMNTKKPEAFDAAFYEYGVRLKTQIKDTMMTLMYFNGIANTPVKIGTGARAEFAYDGRMLLHPQFNGYYPDFRYVGFTLTKDFENLYASSLGGVAPTVRLETIYAFDSSFETSLNTIEKHNEFRWALGIDWKINIPLFNPKAYFTISPQYIQQYVLDYPGSHSLNGLKDINDTFTLLITTSYMHNKLTPTFFWWRDTTNEADYILFKVAYEKDDHWIYTVGTNQFTGTHEGAGFEPFDNKNQIFCTISYRF